MKNHPKVSIFLTSYNHAKYLRESIDSALHQTFSDFELIILDDASTDDSWAIINSYSDPRIRAFRNKTNRLGDFPELFPQAANGEYLAIHHSDDIWELNKLEKQVAYLNNHPDIGAVFTNAMIIDEQGKPFEDKTHFYYNIFNQPNRTRHEWLKFFFNLGNALCHPSVLIRKVCYEQCGLYRYGLFQLPDFDMWIRLCLKYEIHVMPKKLVRFRVREYEENVSGNQPEKRIRSMYEFYKTLENYKKIERFDDLVKVFPKAEKYNRGDETDIHFSLAMIALEEKPFIFTELFGLNILFELISDPIRSANIKRLYNFDYMNFIDLTGKHEIFSQEKIVAFYQEVVAASENQEKIVALYQEVVAARENQEKIAALYQAAVAANENQEKIIALYQEAVAARENAECQLQHVYNTKSWRVTLPLRRVSGFVSSVKGYLSEEKKRQDLIMMIETIGKIFFIALSNPLTMARKFSPGKIKVLIRALKNESPQQCIANFKRYLVLDALAVKEEFLQDKKKYFDDFIQSGSVLSFPGGEPVLSIIVVLFNQVALSYACLQSILRNVSMPYEVIIVDNHSTDETNLLLDKIKGATIIRNDKNLHFLKANNQAMEHVKGEYLLFLNNDTEIMESTISSAIHTLNNNEKCGAVGGKLVLSDGKLQEAGSIIWNDGSCLGYGRNENPQLPEFNFKRVTDYCSAAFLLTHAQLFREHCGFDNRFEPAYYEETDYCLWLQEKGLQVIYDPGALVSHFEFGSDISNTGKTLMQKNQLVFYEKHQKQLKKHFAFDSANLLMARFATSQREKKKVLYIDDRVPHCDLGAGFPRSNTIVNMIKELGYDLTIYPLNFPNEDNWETAYRDINPYIEIARGYGLNGFKTFITIRKEYFDIIWISRPHNMKAVGGNIRFLKEKCKIIYDAEAIFTDREIMKEEISGKIISQEMKNKWYKNEFKLSDTAHAIACVSENDALKFKRSEEKNIFVLGHTMEINKFIPEFEEREGLLFVGNLDDDDSPNVDSVIWFVNDIFPIIRQTIPNMTIDIVGSANSSMIQSKKNDGVFIHGKVASISYFYNKCRIFVAPTRFAAGIPFKIHEAASFGLPVVATRLLCDQLGWHHRQELLAADIDKIDFAQKIIELYNNIDLWNSLQKNALTFIRNTMSRYVYKQKIADILRLQN
jgi:O-antigen biosynthesis protein